LQEKRQHVRTQITLKTKITHPVLGAVTLLTRDISDSGMFLIIEGSPIPPIGEIVDVQILDIMDNPPVCKMKVVRLENNGIGLVLCDIAK